MMTPDNHTNKSLPIIVERHADNASFLWLQRDSAVMQPHYDLKDLAELDERLNAQLDGLAIAGAQGWEVALQQANKYQEPGEIFVAAWLAINALDGKKFDQVFQCTHENPDCERALVSALAWHSFQPIEPLLSSMLNAKRLEYVGIAVNALALHRVDPGKALDKLIDCDQERIQCRAIRAAGELRRTDLLPDLKKLQSHDSDSVSFWAGWAATIMGDRSGLPILKHHLLSNSVLAYRALPLVAVAAQANDYQNLLRTLFAEPETRPLAMRGAGLSGDPYWIPGLLKYMDELPLARAAGEAFALITGVDLAYLDLDKDWPEEFESGPNENPADEDVALDLDENLAWPDAAKVLAWWGANQSCFNTGERYLCGRHLTSGNCRQVLKKGYQRQRQVAAYWLAALTDAPLFEVRSAGTQQIQRLN